MATTRIRTLTAAFAATVVAALAPAAVSAAPAVNGEFPLSATPKQLTTGPDGNVWVAIGTKVAKVTPDGVVTEYDPTDVENSFGITTGPDGNLWVTQPNGVAKFPADDPLKAEKFAIAGISDPRAITTGPDGNLWTASGDKVVKIPPAAPLTATSETVPGMSARDIARGGDGQLWVADFGGQRIVSVTTDFATTPYAVGGGPQGVAAGAGTQIAYANPGANPQNVGRITPGGTPLTTPVPGTDPFGITLGADGAYWVAQFASDTIGRLTADGQVTTLAGLSANSGPRSITTGPGNTLWVGLENAQAVARVTGLEPPSPAQPQPLTSMPTPQPLGDVTKPGLRRLSLSTKTFRVGKRPTLRLRLSEPATLRFTIQRVRKGKGRTLGAFNRQGLAGRNAVRLPARLKGKRLRAGRYRLIVRAIDAAGNVSAAGRVGFRIVSR